MMRREWLQVSAATTLTGGMQLPLALAQEPAKAKSPDEMIHKYLAAEANGLSKRFMDGAKTKEEWEKRPRVKREFLDMLGLEPLPEKTPLKATVTGTLERGDVTIEKLHYQSKPGLYVTGNLYRPRRTPTEREGVASSPRSSTCAGTPAAAATATRPRSRTTACGSPRTATSASSSIRCNSARWRASTTAPTARGTT